MPSRRAAAAAARFLVCLLAAGCGPTDVVVVVVPAVVVVHGLSVQRQQQRPPPPPPPSNNPDVLRSYVFGRNDDDDDDARCWEVLSPSAPPDRDGDGEMEDEEDEVEYWYPTRKRYFEFSIPSSSSSVVSSSSRGGDSACSSTTTTTIRQTSFGCGKLGAEVWDSSVALCLHLGRESLVEGKRVLELGSGCGLPSVVCRDELGAEAVLATDFWETDDDDRTFDGDRLVPTKFHGLNLEHNVRCGDDRNRDDGDDDNDRVVEASVQRLDWHDRASAAKARDSFRPNLVIASDVVYYPMDVEPLLNVLEILLVGGDDAESKRRSIRAVLALPLSPAKREALPEFRTKLPARFSDTHDVTMEERDLLREDTDGEDTAHLIIDMIPRE